MQIKTEGTTDNLKITPKTSIKDIESRKSNMKLLFYYHKSIKNREMIRNYLKKCISWCFNLTGVIGVNSFQNKLIRTLKSKLVQKIIIYGSGFPEKLLLTRLILSAISPKKCSFKINSSGVDIFPFSYKYIRKFKILDSLSLNIEFNLTQFKRIISLIKKGAKIKSLSLIPFERKTNDPRSKNSNLLTDSYNKLGKAFLQAFLGSNIQRYKVMLISPTISPSTEIFKNLKQGKLTSFALKTKYNYKYDPGIFLSMAEFLQKNSQLETLTLEFCEGILMKPQTTKEIYLAISKIKTLKNFQFRASDEQPINELYSALSKTTSLISLGLKLNCKNIKSMNGWDSLSKQVQLKSLDISLKEFSEHKLFGTLTSTVTKFVNLEKIRFEYRVGMISSNFDLTAVNFIKAISNPTIVKKLTLILRDGMISAKGYENMVLLLSKFENLKYLYLDLSGCGNLTNEVIRNNLPPYKNLIKLVTLNLDLSRRESHFLGGPLTPQELKREKEQAKSLKDAEVTHKQAEKIFKSMSSLLIINMDFMPVTYFES